MNDVLNLNVVLASGLEMGKTWWLRAEREGSKWLSVAGVLFADRLALKSHHQCRYKPSMGRPVSDSPPDTVRIWTKRGIAPRQNAWRHQVSGSRVVPGRAFWIRARNARGNATGK